MDTLSKLKTDYINEVRQENPAYADRLTYRRCEIILASLLTRTYAAFVSMQMNRCLAERDSLSFEKAEEIANTLNSKSTMEIAPQSIMHSRDICANMAVDDYNAMCKVTEVLEDIGYNKADIEALCEQVKNESSNLETFRIEALIHYNTYADLLLLYLTGDCTDEDFTSLFVEYNIFTQKTQPINIRQLMRDRRNLLDLFYKIIQERETEADKHNQ